MSCVIILHNMVLKDRSEYEPCLKELLAKKKKPQIPTIHCDPIIHQISQSIHHHNMKLQLEVIHHLLMNTFKVHNCRSSIGNGTQI